MNEEVERMVMISEGHPESEEFGSPVQILEKDNVELNSHLLRKLAALHAKCTSAHGERLCDGCGFGDPEKQMEGSLSHGCDSLTFILQGGKGKSYEQAGAGAWLERNGGDIVLRLSQ